MDILYERVAGLDVHKDTVVACVRIVAEGKARRRGSVGLFLAPRSSL